MIAYGGYAVLRETVPVLVDSAAVDAERIESFVLDVGGVQAVRNVRSRGRRNVQAFAELTVVIDGDLTVMQGHEIADRVERLLIDAGGFDEVVVHVEPPEA